MRIEHQLKAFEQILKSYDGTLPLHRFLFAYFKRNKQMGSSDRRWASRYIYNFFRLGKALIKEEYTLRLAVADFLCSQTTSLMIETYLPALKEQMEQPISEKLVRVKQQYPSFELKDIFSWPDQLSGDIDLQEFFTSFLMQPKLFLRVDAGYSEKIAALLEKHEIAVSKISHTTLALPNGSKLETILAGQKYYQIQDLSSQRTGSFFKPEPWDKWWDCCAASGGKSLLLYDLEPSVELLVSDVRENSLHNLDERFLEAGLKKYQKKVLDLLQNNEQDLHHYEFDGIILDAPCSGSGTWGRTPEMLCYFDEHKISYFSGLQKTIAANVVKYLKEGKPLIYITCSIFKEENEDVVTYLLKNLPLQLEDMQLIKGYTEKADTMFVARLIKQ